MGREKKKPPEVTIIISISQKPKNNKNAHWSTYQGWDTQIFLLFNKLF